MLSKDFRKLYHEKEYVLIRLLNRYFLLPSCSFIGKIGGKEVPIQVYKIHDSTRLQTVHVIIIYKYQKTFVY